MTDKELLEKAAKVAGARWDDNIDSFVIKHSDGVWREFKPLADDGDALRLAVKLGIQIDPTDEMYVFAGRDMDATELGYCECKNGDPMQATRRAITRAAAAMADK